MPNMHVYSLLDLELWIFLKRKKTYVLFSISYSISNVILFLFFIQGHPGILFTERNELQKG